MFAYGVCIIAGVFINMSVRDVLLRSVHHCWCPYKYECKRCLLTECASLLVLLCVLEITELHH